MVYVKPKETKENINFLASEHFQSFSMVATSASVTAGADGKKVIKGGTVFPTNDANAKGIVLYDVDVTYGDQPIPVIVEGYILEARLPVTPAAAAKTALKEIKFF